MARSDAYQRFIDSMEMNYEKWHDGVGYDLDALAQMTPQERQSIVGTLTAGSVEWRHVEALAMLAKESPAALEALIKAQQDHLNIDTRLAAAEALHELGQLDEIDTFLARQIRSLSSISNGCTRALLMAEEFPTDRVKQALLWASWNRTECSIHCAALLCYLVGVAKEQFDWDLRPLFLRLGEHESYFEREKAFDELCKLVKMELDTSQE